jgi:hypothetical protein
MGTLSNIPLNPFVSTGFPWLQKNRFSSNRKKMIVSKQKYYRLVKVEISVLQPLKIKI